MGGEGRRQSTQGEQRVHHDRQLAGLWPPLLSRGSRPAPHQPVQRRSCSRAPCSCPTRRQHARPRSTGRSPARAGSCRPDRLPRMPGSGSKDALGHGQHRALHNQPSSRAPHLQLLKRILREGDCTAAAAARARRCHHRLPPVGASLLQDRCTVGSGLRKASGATEPRTLGRAYGWPRCSSAERLHCGALLRKMPRRARKPAKLWLSAAQHAQQ